MQGRPNAGKDAHSPVNHGVGVRAGHGSFLSWVLVHPVRHEKGAEHIDGEDGHRLFLNACYRAFDSRAVSISPVDRPHDLPSYVHSLIRP